MNEIETRLEELERQISRLASVVNQLQARVDSIQKGINPSSIAPLSSRSISVSDSPIADGKNTMIPEAMKRTVNVLLQISKHPLTSGDISKVTGRSRHLESSYLCRLYEQGLLNRRRVGRKVYYSFAEKDN